MCVCEDSESYVYIAWWVTHDVCMCVVGVCVRSHMCTLHDGWLRVTLSHICTLYDRWGCVHVCYTGVCEDSESYVYITWWMRMCACVLYGCVWGLGVICVHCMMGDSWCVHVCCRGVCEESYVYVAWWVTQSDSESYLYIVWSIGMCACVLYGCVWRLGVICVHCMMDEDVWMCVIRVCVRTRSHMCTLHDGWVCVHVCYTGVCEDSESYVYTAWWVTHDVCMCVIRVCVRTRSHMYTLHDGWGCMHVCYTGVCEDSESYVYIEWWMRMCACVLYRCVWGLAVICVHCMMGDDVCMCVKKKCKCACL